MKLATANIARNRYMTMFVDFLRAQGEDVELVSSNSCNFPFVEGDEEGVMYLTASVTKKDYDECMQERVDYVNHCAEVAEKKAAKAKEAEEKKAKKEKKE